MEGGRWKGEGGRRTAEAGRGKVEGGRWKDDGGKWQRKLEGRSQKGNGIKRLAAARLAAKLFFLKKTY